MTTNTQQHNMMAKASTFDVEDSFSADNESSKESVVKEDDAIEDHVDDEQSTGGVAAQRARIIVVSIAAVLGFALMLY
eukprot:scaffold3471_cov175-Amphora_coffeaeformis.AAC.5